MARKNKTSSPVKNLISVTKTNEICATIRVSMPPRGEFRVLLSSCRHQDNPRSLRGMELDHLYEVRETGAGIIDLGDLFCAMQGRHDPRRSDDGKREEDTQRGYFNKLIEHAIERYSAWHAHWLVLGSGNHETSVEKNCNIDLTMALANGLRKLHGSPVVDMGYRFWVRFRFESRGKVRSTKTMYCFHGKGGGGITKGAIDEQRRHGRYPDADIIVSGHIHESRDTDHVSIRLNQAGVEERRTQIHVQIPTYKDEAANVGHGWAVEKELAPKPSGATWLIFKERNDEIIIDTARAR